MSNLLRDIHLTSSNWNYDRPDLQNLIRSSVEASEYSLLVSSKLFKALMRYRGNNKCLGKWTNEQMQQTEPKNIMPSVTVLSSSLTEIRNH